MDLNRSDGPMKFNVGGTIFLVGSQSISRSKLLTAAATAFYRPHEFSNSDLLRFVSLYEDVIFIDQDSDDFGQLLQYLRTGEIRLERNDSDSSGGTVMSAFQRTKLLQFRRSFAFYGIEGSLLCEQCSTIFDADRNLVDSCLHHPGRVISTDSSELMHECCRLPSGSIGCKASPHIHRSSYCPRSRKLILPNNELQTLRLNDGYPQLQTSHSFQPKDIQSSSRPILAAAPQILPVTSNVSRNNTHEHHHLNNNNNNSNNNVWRVDPAEGSRMPLVVEMHQSLSRSQGKSRWQINHPPLPPQPHTTVDINRPICPPQVLLFNPFNGRPAHLCSESSVDSTPRMNCENARCRAATHSGIFEYPFALEDSVIRNASECSTTIPPPPVQREQVPTAENMTREEEGGETIVGAECKILQTVEQSSSVLSTSSSPTKTKDRQSNMSRRIAHTDKAYSENNSVNSDSEISNVASGEGKENNACDIPTTGRAKQKQVGNPRYKTKMCPLFRTGECRKSSVQCKFAHGLNELRGTGEYFKTQICVFWKAGFCKAGVQCRHAHGSNDLRLCDMGPCTRDSYIRDKNAQTYEESWTPDGIDVCPHPLPFTSSSSSTALLLPKVKNSKTLQDVQPQCRIVWLETESHVPK